MEERGIPDEQEGNNDSSKMVPYPYNITVLSPRSSIEPYPTMALDVFSLADDAHSSARSFHDSEQHETGSIKSMRSMRKKKKKPKNRRMSMSDVPKSSSTLTITTVSSTGSKRRRKKKNPDLESFGNLVSRDLSLKKRRGKKTKKKDTNDKPVDQSIDQSIDRSIDLSRTEHTSNLTEHSSATRRRIEAELDKAWDPVGVATEYTSSKNENNESEGESSDDETTTSFATLLSKWKNREDENREKTKTTAGDGDSQRTKHSYLAESETENCFEGVLKHWKYRDNETKVEVNETKKEEELHQETVVVDDGASVISSLAWGDDSVSRFDFGYDARHDSVLKMSPVAKLRKSTPDVTGDKKKKKKKKDESKSKKRSDKKKSQKKLDAFEAALKETESVFAGSTIAESTSILDATDVSTIASLADSVSCASRSKKKKKKKKDESKSKKSRQSKMKKGKSKKRIALPETAVDASESTDEASEYTVDNLDATNTTFASMDEEGRISDDEAATKAYLPNWLSPKDTMKKSIKSGSKVKPGSETPNKKKQTMQIVPDLLSSPVKPVAETPIDTTEKSDLIPEKIPYLPNIDAIPTKPDP